MLVTKQPVLRKLWYPAILITELSSSLKPFELLGEKIVIWLDAVGKPAVQNRYYQRSAQLSIGKVVGVELRYE